MGAWLRLGTNMISRHSGPPYSGMQVLSGWRWVEVTNLPTFQDTSKDASCTFRLAALRATLVMFMLPQWLPQRGSHRWSLQSVVSCEPGSHDELVDWFVTLVKPLGEVYSITMTTLKYSLSAAVTEFISAQFEMLHWLKNTGLQVTLVCWLSVQYLHIAHQE